MFKLKVRVCKRNFITIINTRNFIISIICKTCRKLLYKSHRTFISQMIQCIIGIIETTNTNKNELFWKEWRDILLAEYDGRLADLGAKVYRNVPARETFTTIFLQVKCFSVPASDILPEAIRIIKGKDGFHPLKELDDIAMLGHRIGMLENSSGIKQYLQDVTAALKPVGQILFTAVDLPSIIESQNKSSRIFNSLQLQQANLIGPFFALVRTKTDSLKKQAAAANWQCEIIYRQDETNYLGRLSPPESM